MTKKSLSKNILIKKQYQAIFLVFFILFWTCSAPVRKQNGEFKSAMKEYDRASKLLEEGEWQDAALIFNRLINNNPDFAEGYSGLALILAQRGEFDKAHEYAQKGYNLNQNSVETNLIFGQIFLLEKHDNWFEQASRFLNHAKNIQPDNTKVLYYLGESYFQNSRYDEAQKYFDKVIGLGGELSNLAQNKVVAIHHLQKARPTSDMAKELFLVPELTRAALAALLVEEMKIDIVLQKKQPQVSGLSNLSLNIDTINDISGSWAESWIKKAVQCGGMDVYPGGEFRPEEKVLRAQLAIVMQNIFVKINGDESLFSAYMEEPSRFPDVKRTHYAYNAICLVVDKEIMETNPITGFFNLNEIATPAEALLAIQKTMHIFGYQF